MFPFHQQGTVVNVVPLCSTISLFSLAKYQMMKLQNKERGGYCLLIEYSSLFGDCTMLSHSDTNPCVVFMHVIKQRIMSYLKLKSQFQIGNPHIKFQRYIGVLYLKFASLVIFSFISVHLSLNNEISKCSDASDTLIWEYWVEFCN